MTAHENEGKPKEPKPVTTEREFLLYTSGPVFLKERLLYTLNKLFVKQVKSFLLLLDLDPFYSIEFITQHKVHQVRKSMRYFHISYTDSLQSVSFLSKFSSM